MLDEEEAKLEHSQESSPNLRPIEICPTPGEAKYGERILD